MEDKVKILSELPCINHIEESCTCMGSMLRFPNMSTISFGIENCNSTICPWHIEGTHSHNSRIPFNVTLDKVLDIAEGLGYISIDIGPSNKAMQAEGDMYQVDMIYKAMPWDCRSGKGPTRLEAACDALIEIIKYQDETK